MYHGCRFAPDIISYAVWLYHRFSLGFRDVEDLLAERGITVSHEAIRQWCGKFGSQYARRLKRRQGRLGDTWHLDELFVTVQGRRHYLWRAVDRDGEVIDIYLQPRRERASISGAPRPAEGGFMATRNDALPSVGGECKQLPCRPIRTRGTLFSLAVVLCLGTVASVASADVPPPPVNQSVGIPDTVFGAMTEAVCRSCHGPNTADRHHIAADSAGIDCTTCHPFVWDEGCGCYVVGEFRDCLHCHDSDTVSRPAPPHHTTDSATLWHCSDCHGSVVQDFDDDHYIPDYDITDFTPDPSCKTWDGPICVSGGCEVCHVADPSANPPIASMAELHHSTRVACAACHKAHQNIRDCEACHGVDSLHNIQADSGNPAHIGTIVPGDEDFGWGHIGNSWDCFSCHESFAAASSARAAAASLASAHASAATPQTASTVPAITSVAPSSVSAGQAVDVTIDGVGFTNASGAELYVGEARLAADSLEIVLDTVAVSESQLVATLMATLAPGSYALRVHKADKRSNPISLVVLPEVRIDGATTTGDGVRIVGEGFSDYPAGYATDQGVTVSRRRKTHSCSIGAWSDTEVNAICPIGRGTVMLTGIYGSATAKLTRDRRGRGSSEGKGRTCSDGQDNDGDGQIDCADPHCASSKKCRWRASTRDRPGRLRRDSLVWRAGRECRPSPGPPGG
jgi:hypothetical protein